ncbi:MAG: insulinase family protein, partial [Bacteroidia bacterium]|nr:insulinase family protein [Bacteroidia bacterium]
GKFQNGKNALMQNIETSRILKTSILFDYDNSLKMGYKEDPRKQMANRLESITMDDVVKFHSEKIQGDYQFAVLGSEESIDFEILKKYGKVEMLPLELLFGY